MVAIKYKGQNSISFSGKAKIVNGINEIPDDLFYDLMKQKLFAVRVKSGIFEVPKGFPLEKPVKKADPVEKPQENVEPIKEKEPEVEVKQSLKQALRSISTSDDKEFLENLILVDKRETVQEAAKARLEALDKPKE